jgi:hypothetical protein
MRRLLLLLLAAISLQQLTAQRTIVHCGQLIDTRKLQVLKEMSVIIEGNKVVDVQKGYTAGAPGDKLST